MTIRRAGDSAEDLEMTKEAKEPMSMAIEVASTKIKARGGTQRVGKALHSNGHG